MNFEITCQISLENSNAEDLLRVLTPENQTMKDGTVQSYLGSKDKVVSEIRGKMSIGTLLNTVDDIIKTSILFNQVTESTD